MNYYAPIPLSLVLKTFSLVFLRLTLVEVLTSGAPNSFCISTLVNHQEQLQLFSTNNPLCLSDSKLSGSHIAVLAVKVSFPQFFLTLALALSHP
jgi:hypothetical protein